MSDPNAANFAQRVTRIAQSHAKGQGFQAEGTLGWAESRPRMFTHTKRPWLRVAVYALVFGAALKVLALASLGTQGYALRVSEMTTGAFDSDFLRMMMVSGPVTETLGEVLRSALHG